MLLSDSEKALYSELIVQITARMAEICLAPNSGNNKHHRENRYDFKNLVIYHSATSDFERACAVLQKAGVVHLLKDDGTPQDDANTASSLFQVKVDVPELHTQYSQGIPTPDIPLSEVLESFLSLATGYGPQSLSTRREAFTVPDVFAWSIYLLKQCGYVEQAGDKVQWTNKTAPMMQAIYAWDKNGVSEAERYDAEVNEMWQTMPPKIRKDFFSGDPGDGIDFMSLSFVISRFWYDGKWQEIDCDEGKNPKDHKWLEAGAVPKAIDLQKKFRESRG